MRDKNVMEVSAGARQVKLFDKTCNPDKTLLSRDSSGDHNCYFFIGKIMFVVSILCPLILK